MPKNPNPFGLVFFYRRQNPAAIWDHLDPEIKVLKNTIPAVDTLQFFLLAQCHSTVRKKTYYFHERLFHYGQRHGTWSFFEAFHGKGAADGIKGGIEMAADTLVSYGKDIMNAKYFLGLLNNGDRPVKMLFVKPEKNSMSKVTSSYSTLKRITAKLSIDHIN